MDKEMSAEDLCEIFCKTRPELFNHFYKECKLIFEAEQGLLDKKEPSEEAYWCNESLNIARAITYDYNKQQAHKIGRIIVSATELQQ